MKLDASAGRVKAFVAALVVLVTAAALIQVLVAATEQRAQRQHIQLLNRSAVSLIMRSLGDDLATVRGDALALAQPQVAEQMLATPDDAVRKRVEQLFKTIAQARGDYAQIRLIDTRGHEVVRVNTDDGVSRAVPPNQLQDKHARPYVEATSRLQAGEFHVSRMDLNIEQGQVVYPLEPTLRLGVPVFGSDGRRLGMVVINLDGRRMLASIAEDTRLAHGTIWLVDREGNWLIGPDPAREWRFMTPEQPAAGLATDFPAIWTAIRTHRAGQLRGPFGLLTFDKLALDGQPGAGAKTPILRVVALASKPGLAGILFDRPHLLSYLLSLPVLLILAGWLAHLRTLLMGARGEVVANSRLLQDIFDHANLAMKVKDLQGRIVRANGAAGRLLGRPPKELVGQTIDVVATPKTAAMIRAHDHEVAEGGRVTTYEEEVDYLGGSHTLLTTRFPVTDEHGRIAGVGTISLDITPRIRMEQWLRLAKEQAEAANVAKATFLANMSHELRTPLNSIIGLGELLVEQAEESAADALSLESLRRVVGAGHHLLALINDILDISKVEAGRIDLRPEPLHATALIESVLTSLRPLATANGNTLTLEVREDPGIVHVDAVRLRQVLINLVGNAIKFTRDGGVTVRVSRGDDTLHVAVADTGIGMTEDQLARIFVAFEQADRSISRRFGGSGLGLAISRQLIELMGGRIDVTSEFERGSVFTVVLPMGVPAELETGGNGAGHTALSGLPRQSVVLVVDDDADARDLIQATLERDGIRVITAASGAEALTTVRRERPAVMVLDILLGDMTGWDVLVIVRADPDHAELPVILCTITDRDHRTAQLGVVEHLTKPVDRHQLKTLVRRFVDTEEAINVLVVDDDDVYREQLALVLRNHGHHVRQAAGGEQALQQMRHAPPDMVLLDLVMPGMDGLEVILAMQADAALNGIPVVLVTAADIPEQVVERLNERAILLVRKGESDHVAIASKVRDLIKCADMDVDDACATQEGP